MILYKKDYNDLVVKNIKNSNFISSEQIKNVIIKIFINDGEKIYSIETENKCSCYICSDTENKIYTLDLSKSFFDFLVPIKILTVKFVYHDAFVKRNAGDIVSILPDSCKCEDLKNLRVKFLIDDTLDLSHYIGILKHDMENIGILVYSESLGFYSYFKDIMKEIPIECEFTKENYFEYDLFNVLFSAKLI
ncbi:hypothetical protein CWI38_0148p0070 [Hamiltosporidium tvaerminnensis]|uniref:Uncharacterized protein n=1 Tax=Hamiltosporidium tvaerminnensis TaxID=1176355 RepID=A0A4Q9M082_9MICR|nr:hypothetical protein LUQ84_001671 [Hamiltosporidium tvaerminnensis]TBU01452.1 hypothetical protein CWI37_0707p0010 [Hamiltosporidium tvaerminnensis]TBU20024.1 hypothetical protein CWI38_0148p0070 [Hamiltosporidium tvaerminnensis]